jgi:hypothetical protein
VEGLVVLDCVNYPGHISNSGYGLDYEPSTKKTILAHRKAYKDFYGEVPHGLVVSHSCNNKKCVNPLHLKAVTQSENVKQAYKDGLAVSPNRDKTKEFVLAVLNAIGSQREIARQFNTTQTVVKNIKNGKTYCDLTKGGVCGS